MSSSQRPCPRCSFPLDIPQPLPPRLQCPRCGATIKLKAGPSEQEPHAGTPAAPALATLPPAGPPSAIPVNAVAALPRGSGFSPAADAVVGPVAPTSSRRPLVLWGAGGVAFLAGAVFLIAWAFRGGEDPVKTVEPPPERKVEFKERKAAPPNPRIKIVQPAVDKGVAFLKKHVLQLEKMPPAYINPAVENYLLSVTGQPQPKDIRPGYAGLIGLALLEGGLAHDDPALLQIADIIRQASPQMIGIYDLSASLFFLNRWQESAPLNEKDRAMAQTLSLRIIAGQMPSGIWGYKGVVMPPDAQAKLLSALKQGTYKPGGPGHGPTMSCTQFAMLAVWGSRKHGVPVREPMLALSAYFHANQLLPNGNWIYPGASLAATSTCAGLISLAIERVLLEDKEFAAGQPAPVREKKADVDLAFEFLGKTIGRERKDANSGSSLGYGGGIFDADALGDLYFLWTLERVGVIYSRDVIGGKDWFDWGYPIVLKAQRRDDRSPDDGSWEEKHSISFGPLIDTSFAILFLTRSNIAKDVTDKLRLLRQLSGAQSSLLPARRPWPDLPAREDNL